MREKCERGHPFSTPGLRFHGVDRADVFNNIRVRAIRCGECALNSPTSQPIPRRSPSSTPAQRHALAEHFRLPTQRRCTPAGCAMHSPPKTFVRPRTATRPSRALPLPHAAPMHARRLRDAFPTDRTTHSSPKVFARPEHFRPPTQPPSTPADCAIHTRRLRDAFLAGCAIHSPLKTFVRPRTATRPSRALPLPHAAPMHARRPHIPFPADPTTHSPSKAFARPAQRHALPEHFRSPTQR